MNDFVPPPDIVVRPSAPLKSSYWRGAYKTSQPHPAAYYRGLSDHANGRSYAGEKLTGARRVAYDHGWVDSRELQTKIAQSRERKSHE